MKSSSKSDAGRVQSFDAVPWIFDRRRARHHWLRAFRDLEATEPTRRAVCKNWRMDHRVSEDREQELLAEPIFAQEPTGDLWWRQRREAFEQLVCRPALPTVGGDRRSAYLEPANSNNAISSQTLPGHEQLIHVASLNRILERLTTAEHPGSVDLRLRFFDLTGHELPRQPLRGGFDREAFDRAVDAIAATVNQRGEAAVGELTGALCDALGPREPPWWAGFAHELMPHLKQEDGILLCQALGMGHLDGGEWLLVWRYEVRVIYEMAAGVGVYRPTVIEANDSAFHFPSPPGYRYGITLTLADPSRGACREVIHPPLKGEAATEACTGTLLQLATPPLSGYDQLESLRDRHRNHLERVHPEPETIHWLERHPSP